MSAATVAQAGVVPARRLSPAGWVALLLGAGYLVFLNPHLDFKSFNAHDPATYLLGAQSMWRGDGYALRFADAVQPMKLQPPGLAFLLAPVVGLFGINFVALKLFMVLLAGLMAWAGFAFFRRFLSSTTQAGMATLLLLASPVVFRLAHQVMAEIPLILCSTIALVHLDRYLRSPVRILSRPLVVAAAATAGGYFFKGVGLAVLLGGWLLLCHPRYRTRRVLNKLLWYTALVAIPIALWQVRCSLTPSVGFHGKSMLEFYLRKDGYVDGSPLASLPDLLIRMRHNIVWGMAAGIAAAVVAPLHFMRNHPDVLACLLGLPVVCWLGWQWFTSCRTEPSVLEGFTFVGLTALLLYIHGYAERYLTLLYPALLVYAFRGFSTSLADRWRELVPRMLIALSIASTVVAAVDQWRDPFGSDVVRDYVDAGQQAQAAFPPGSRCVAPMVSHWQVLTGHQCLADEASVGARAPVDYALVLADPEAFRHHTLRDFHRDLVRAALSTTEAVTQQVQVTATIYENRTFRLVRLGRS